MVEATRLPGASGRVVAVIGGSGGVGASTVAAALAVVGARQGSSVMLVDTDPLGGGLDLMIGAERVGGWRWPRLATARGHLGDLSGQVPHVDGVDVVSMGRGAGPTQAPGFDAARAVLLSAGRSHDLVIVDVGRALWGRVSDTLRMADLAILLAHAGVRGIAAGRQTLGWLEEQSECWGLLLRQPRAGGLRVEEAAEAFDLPLLGSIADDPAIAVAAELGEPPARAGRSQLARACVQVLAAAVGRGPVVE